MEKQEKHYRHIERRYILTARELKSKLGIEGEISDVNLLSGKNFSVGSNIGINGNYSVGSCWIKFTGGIATSTNCTSA